MHLIMCVLSVFPCWFSAAKPQYYLAFVCISPASNEICAHDRHSVCDRYTPVIGARSAMDVKVSSMFSGLLPLLLRYRNITGPFLYWMFWGVGCQAALPFHHAHIKEIHSMTCVSLYHRYIEFSDCRDFSVAPADMKWWRSLPWQLTW